MIETARLSLRPLRIDDVDAFVDLPADDRVNRFAGAYSREQALERLRTIERQWTERGHGLCAVHLRRSGEFLGRRGLNYWQASDEIEAGWTFKAEAWGRGYATEAARASPHLAPAVRYNAPPTRSGTSMNSPSRRHRCSKPLLASDSAAIPALSASG